MNLYKFIELAIETIGGVMIPLEYALCTVLIPEQYQDFFQGKNEILLAFDYEVAQENPKSEFVTYGSYIFDTLFQIARTLPLTTQRYVQVERLELNNAAEKIKKYKTMESGTLDIIEERKVMGLWGLYHFTILYVSDERFEETKEVWVNLIDGKVDPQITTGNIFYDTKQTMEGLPYLQPVQMQYAFKNAQKGAEQIATDKAEVLTDRIKIQAEVDRITKYYDEMIAENKKRASRKGVTEERIKEIVQKENALIVEKSKQIHEIEEKYLVKTTVLLENAIVYHIPLLEFTCKISYHRNVYEQLFYYEPVFKRWIEGEVF